MYSLEYGMMVQVLRRLGFSGEFHADVAPQAALREGGRVVLSVHSGIVVACFILNKNGQKLYHDAETQRLLPMLGILDWKLVSSISTKTAPPAAPPAAPVTGLEGRGGNFVPYRLNVPEVTMRSWSPLERSVYLLADGKRTVGQIAALLSRPLPVIEQIIHNFETSGVIAQIY